MHYCAKEKFVFQANPKTGTRSMLGWLSLAYKVDRWRGDHSIPIPPHMADWFSFTVVRNPYDRMASLYWTAHNKTEFRNKSFETYLRTTFRPQTKWANAAKLVLRFENLEEELKKLPFWHDAPFPWTNDSRTKKRNRLGSKWKPMPPKEELLTPETRKLILEKYAQDFELFGYRK